MIHQNVGSWVEALSGRVRRLWLLAPIGAVRRIVSQAAPECRLVLILCVAPMVLRTMLLVEQSLPCSASDIHGFLSDATVSGVVAVVMVAAMHLLGRRPRIVLAVIVAVCWTLIHVGNYEHISALGAPLQFTYAQYMRDGVFLTGSALSVSSTALLILLMAIGVFGMLAVAKRGAPTLSWQTRAVAVLAVAFTNAAWPTDPRALAWRDSNFMELLIRPARAKTTALSQRSALPATFRSNVAGDLSGTPILSLGKTKTNVLLVILEGISGGNIPSMAAVHGVSQEVDMPKLSAIAETGIAYPSFLNNQRQTNRGEFALLCGRLDYLISGTSRMTEYARDGGEPCLPRVLAQNGYRTAYIQPAPLSFMLKDQFMDKAGFTDVHGPELFQKSYARTSWGVDDRAFFEQAFVTINELNASGTPWFTTLLTVGTHHPYTVPKNFRTGTTIDRDPHGLAVRYLDAAVAEFVENLEKSGLLDNTLLLLTSDESFGVNGYDDVTQLLSYNWGFLIAKAPGERARVIDEPHAQTDVALTIVDYLGVSAEAFVGRSLFRKYDDPRHLVFGNTYQQKVFWAAPPYIVECDEAVSSCQKHTITGKGLFSPQRSSSAALDPDLSPLREMVALTSTRRLDAAAGRTPLMLDNAAIWDVGVGRQNLVFAGQYFTLNADEELVVALDATLDGPESSLILDADVYSGGRVYEVFPPPLYDGDRVRFDFAYAPGRPLHNVEVRLTARKHDGESRRVIMRKAEMRVRRRTLMDAGGITTNFQLQRTGARQVYYLGSGLNGEKSKPGFVLNPCVSKVDQRDFVATNCRRGSVIYGPYISVSAGSVVRATFDVSTLVGGIKVRAEIVSSSGREVLAPGKEVNQKEQTTTPLVTTVQVDRDVKGLEARLVLMGGDENAVFYIRRAVLEVIPGDTPQARADVAVLASDKD